MNSEEAKSAAADLSEAAASAAVEAVKEIGQLLKSALESLASTDISEELQNAVSEMASAGTPISDTLKEASDSVLKSAIEGLNSEEFQAFSDAVSKATDSGLEAFGSLWQDLLKEVPGDIYEAGKAMSSDLASTATAAGKEAASDVAKLLLIALDSIKETVPDDVLEALQDMKSSGKVASSAVLDSVNGVFKSAIKSLDNEQLQLLQTAMSTAIADGIETLRDLWESLQEFMSEAIENGQKVAKLAAPVIAVTSDAAVSVAKTAGANAKVLASEIYNTDIVSSVIGPEGFEAIDDAITDTREAMTAAMSALAGLGATGCVAASCPLLRFEIFRDFAQIISLFFTNLFQIPSLDAPWIDSARNIFGGISNFIAIDVANALQSDTMVEIGIVLLIVVAVVIYVAYGWFILSARNMHATENELREGHETKTWATIAAERSKAVKFTTYVITGCLSAYLPLTKLGVEILMKKPDSLLVSHFTTKTLLTNGTTITSYDQELDILTGVSIFILVTFTLPLPFILASIIKSNIPTGTAENPDVAYDVDGEEVMFDDKLYNRLVNDDPNQQRCPYRSLYKGFERRWANYKVYQLVYKVALVLTVVVFAEKLQAGITLGIYSTIAALSFYTTPFINPLDDIMDASGRVTALTTCVGGALVTIVSDNNSLAQIVGLILNIVNAVNIVIMGTVFLFGVKKFRLAIKNYRGTFTFSDTVLDIASGPAISVVPTWDLDREVKHRVWHNFWENILLNKCGENVALRLLELKDSTASNGIENVRQHWEGEANASVAEMRMKCHRDLEGVDVYWNDATGTRDGVLDSASYFGKMYVHPYPFHCIVIYDDAADESFIRHDKFEAFYNLNISPEVLKKRNLRQKLRALGRWGGKISFPFSREETETVADGTRTETSTDSEGNQTTREVTNYSTVTFTCYYTNGVISVGANTKKAMADGFNVKMTYNDGYGDARLPNTGKNHHFSNRTAVMGHSHIDLSPEMTESVALSTIFNQCASAISTNISSLLQEHQEYRNGLIQKHREANTVLNDGFWYYVFNNANLSREELERYLVNQETNEVLSSIPTKYVSALDFVYKRMAFVNLHDAIKLWFVFWEDFYNCNKDMEVMKKLNDDDFNPLKGSAICYKPMKREELANWLSSRKLLGSNPFFKGMSFGPQLFNDNNLSVLYDRMGYLQDPNNVLVKV